ncbi:MAG: sulfatase-like hydrolase/transferase [Thermodesulfobacteriota bacterium]
MTGRSLQGKQSSGVMRWGLFILLTFALHWAYVTLSQFWALHGGGSSGLFYFEYPLVIIFCWILNFNGAKRTLLSIHMVTPILTVFGVYLCYDFVYTYFARSPRLSDFQNVWSLFSVSPLLFFGFLGWVALTLAPLGYSFSAWRKNTPPAARFTLLTVKTISLVLLIMFIGSQRIYSYQKPRFQLSTWSETEAVRKNGRLSALFYYYHKRQETLTKLKRQGRLEIFNHFYKGRVQKKSNIHIVVLESFVDPRKIKGLSFNRSPLNEALHPFLIGQNQNRFSMIESPVYGGGTAQAEFELLTGIPALSLADSIEFNLFSGGTTDSFVSRLKSIGYYTIASVATEPVFYNSQNAYQGIGFDEVHFLGTDAYFIAKTDSEHLFDGDLLRANGNYILQLQGKKGHGRPVLNYVVGMYGHIPFTRDRTLRPDVIATIPEGSPFTEIANQFYYRTGAVAEFIRETLKNDPEAIILVTSDHLPPIFNHKIRYQGNSKANIALLIVGGKAVDLSGKKYFELSHLIWNLLAGSSEPTDTASIFSGIDPESIYLSYLAEAAGVTPDSR